MHPESITAKAIPAFLFVCFFLSGLAALIYEVVWMRMLTQIFGSTAYAVATVLAGFMAGLALGSYVFGRLMNQERDFLRLYGILEFGIGLYGLLVPLFFSAGRNVYGRLFWLYDDHAAIFNLLIFLLSFTLLVFPTSLMGATLPVLSRFFVRNFTHLGRRVGNLYGTNTLGAVAGCALAGYYLLPAFGVTRTVYVAALLNVAIGAAVLWANWRAGRKSQTLASEPAPAPQTGASQLPSALGSLLLLAIGISGAAAMVYENAWTHALALVIGSSVYSFTTMLVTFLSGLALGGYLYARCLGAGEARMTSLALLQLGVGATAMATIPLFGKLPLIFLRLHQGFGDSFSLFLAIQVTVSFTVMFLPTLLLGMTFPMVVRLFTQNLYRVGSGVGTTYASNTVGAILGAILGGFVLIPLVGMRQSILLGAFANLFTGWVLLIADPFPGRRYRAALGGLVAAGLAVLALRLPDWDRSVLTSGVAVYAYTFKPLPTDSLRLEEMRKDEILYYREGRTATVSVHRPRKDYLYLKTNGKIDGSYGDALTMLMTGYVPMLLQPRSERVAVIGLGTAMTLKAIGAFPVKTIEALEIEPAMVEAARLFSEKNGGILDDPRVKIIPTDGRNYLLGTSNRYDLIISEPSNPWIAGVASLFTREFYATAQKKLKPDGLFAQWIHNYSMSPDDFRMVFRTFAESFPHLSVWNLKESDFLLVGSQQPQQFDYRSLRDLFARNSVMREDFKSLGFSDTYAILGLYRMGRKEVVAFTEGADLNTDDNGRLEFSAPRSLHKPTAELNRKLMEPFVAEAPWIARPPMVPFSQHHRYLAEAFRASSWNGRALQETERALKLEPRNADFHLLHAHILVAQEKLLEASSAARKALELERGKAGEVLPLVDELYTTQARVLYLEIIRSGIQAVAAYLGLGNIALYHEDLREAEKWFNLAAKHEPDHARALFALGRLELAKRNYAAAGGLLEQAREKGEDSALLHSVLGETYGHLEQWGKAAHAYERALRRDPQHVERRVSLAEALEQQGNRRAAEVRYREVLALNPNTAEAWRGLRRLGKKL